MSSSSSKLDEASVESPKEEKPPEPGTDAYYEAFGNEIDEHSIGVFRRRRRVRSTLD